MGFRAAFLPPGAYFRVCVSVAVFLLTETSLYHALLRSVIGVDAAASVVAGFSNVSAPRSNSRPASNGKRSRFLVVFLGFPARFPTLPALF